MYKLQVRWNEGTAFADLQRNFKYVDQKKIVAVYSIVLILSGMVFLVGSIWDVRKVKLEDCHIQKSEPGTCYTYIYCSWSYIEAAAFLAFLIIVTLGLITLRKAKEKLLLKREFVLAMAISLCGLSTDFSLWLVTSTTTYFLADLYITGLKAH